MSCEMRSTITRYARRLCHAHFADGRQFRLNAGLAHGVDLLHQRRRKSRLHAEDDSNFLHDGSFVGDTSSLLFDQQLYVKSPGKRAIKTPNIVGESARAG
jgi:hypothetical protein